ncbi:hypothetical protein ACWDUX_10930 [Streptomyces sp. NPDC003444]
MDFPDTDHFSCSVFNSRSGSYAFDPATLMQRRPSYDRENPVSEGVTSIQHERAHWFQFSGSTFGALLMSLHRAEETLLLFGLREKVTDPAALAYVRRGIRTRRSVFSPRQADVPMPEQVADLADTYARLRTARFHLTDGEKGGRRFSGSAEAIAEAFVEADSVYAQHTGGVRPWPRVAVAEVYQSALRARPAVRDGVELTARNLLEAGAVLNELAGIVVSGWPEWRFEAGSRYRPMPSEFRYLVDDVLTTLPPGYGAPIRLALEEWGPHLRGFGETADRFGMALPTLACCIDISVNPPIPPICPPVRSPWAAIYPPLRFLSAVRAVSELGLIEEFPTAETYEEYRREICRLSGLRVGHMTARSFQHPRLTTEFFTSETSGAAALEFSSFDYLIWAVESMNVFRSQHPLRWSMPFLTNVLFDGWDPFQVLFGEFSAVMSAPLFWTGEDLGWGLISSHVARRIVVEKAVYALVQGAVLRDGEVDLASRFPLRFLGAEENRALIAAVAAHTTGIPEFAEREVYRETGHEPEESPRPPEAAPRHPREIHVFRVEREDVVNGNVARLNSFIERLREDPLANARTVDLRFDSYDMDENELWNIPEVTGFLLAVREKIPHWSWYFTAESDLTHCAGLVLIFLAGVENRFAITEDHCIQWLLEVTGDALVSEGERAGADLERLTAMTNDIAAAVISLLSTSFP